MTKMTFKEAKASAEAIAEKACLVAAHDIVIKITEDTEAEEAMALICDGFAAMQTVEQAVGKELKLQWPKEKHVFVTLDLRHIMATALYAAAMKEDLEGIHPRTKATENFPYLIQACIVMEKASDLEVVMEYDFGYDSHASEMAIKLRAKVIENAEWKKMREGKK